MINQILIKSGNFIIRTDLIIINALRPKMPKKSDTPGPSLRAPVPLYSFPRAEQYVKQLIRKNK